MIVMMIIRYNNNHNDTPEGLQLGRMGRPLGRPRVSMCHLWMYVCMSKCVYYHYYYYYHHYYYYAYYK